MTVVEQIPFDQIDNETAATPAWEAYRHQRGEAAGDHAMPRGTYEATLIEATLVRRREGGGWVLRMVARTDGLGRYALAWRGLSENGFDPYDLTEGQVKGLRKFAQSMGVQTPAPARAIVEAVQAMVGGPVMAKVVHTPVGTQATLSREAAESSVSTSRLMVAGQVVAVDGHVLDSDGEVMEGAAAEAFAAHSRVVESQQLARRAVAVGARGCYDLHRSEGWRALGLASLNEYLAQPEVEISRTEFYRLAEIYEIYVLEGGITAEMLAGASSSKLELPIPAIKQGVVSAEQGASDAESLTRNELRTRYRELLGTEGDPDPAPEPRPDYSMDGVSNSDIANANPNAVAAGLADASHRRDEETEALRQQVEQAEARETELRAQLEDRPHQTDLTHMAIAQGLADVLQRVLKEVGRPEQKRMGKELRGVVVAALSQAREHGLDVDDA